MANERLSAILNKLGQRPEFAKIDVPSATMRGSNGNTPLHVAAIEGDIEAVRVLLEAGADPSAVGEHECTPLHEALKREHLQAARILIAAGSSLDAVNCDGLSCRDMTRAVSLWESQH